MVHIFSLGYMKGEERFSTYYAFLGLLPFRCLDYCSGNLFQVYMFWELVGVSSYLLIGYYYDKPSVCSLEESIYCYQVCRPGIFDYILVLAYYGGTLDIGTLIQS